MLVHDIDEKDDIIISFSIENMIKQVKLFMIVISMLITMFGCSDDFSTDNTPSEEETLKVGLRNIKDALAIARQCGESMSETRGTKVDVDCKSVVVIGSNDSRSSSDTLIYAVNFEESKGYVLVSASQAAEPVLAIIDEGSYQSSQGVKSEAFEGFMNRAKEYVKSRIDVASMHTIGTRGSDGMVDFIMMFYKDTIKNQSLASKRIEVEWGQLWPENIYCPNKIAGCVPVAIAQMMSYFKPSITLNLTFNGRPSDALYLDWDSMSVHKVSNLGKNPTEDEIKKHIDLCDADLDGHKLLAAFIRQIGQSLDATYYENSTGTTNKNKAEFIRGLLSTVDGVVQTKVVGTGFYDLLKDGGVALIEGIEKGSMIGHQWVLDGTGSITYEITTYYNYNPKTHEYKSKETKNEVSKYVHCNWGEGGLDNGYFLEGVYDTEKGYNNWIYELSTRYDFSVAVTGTVYKKKNR